MVLYLNKLQSWIPITKLKDALCQVWLKLAVDKKMKFIYYFCFYFNLKEMVVLYFINLNPHHLRMLCVTYGWHSEEDNFIGYLLSPLCIGVVLHLNKLESPSLRNTLCQVSLKLAHWFWRSQTFQMLLTKTKTKTKTNFELNHLPKLIGKKLYKWIKLKSFHFLIYITVTKIIFFLDQSDSYS